jgi:hypothetical protein
MLKTNCQGVAKNLFILIFLSLCFVVLTSSTATALTSTSITFQGKIVRNDSGYEGLNVTNGSPACVQAGADTCDFRVQYYTASSGGTLLLTETFLNLEIGDYGGIFNLSLGNGTVTTTSVCRDGTCNNLVEVLSEYKDVYIEVSFAPLGAGSYTETFSRMALGASAYSISSKYADGAKDAFAFSSTLSAQTTSSPVAGMVYYDSNDAALKLYNGTSWVAVGTGSSSGSLWTQGSGFTYLTATTDAIVMGGDSIATSIFLFDVDATSGNYFKIDNVLGTRLFTVKSDGNVGIGVESPTSKLEVGGSNSTISNTTGNMTISPAGSLVIKPGGSTYPIMVLQDSSGNNLIDIYSNDYRNTFIGLESGTAITSGLYNTSLGSRAFRFNTIGYGNVTLGNYAMELSLTGSKNTAVGAYSLVNSEGDENTSIGYRSMQYYYSSTGAASRNVAIGMETLRGNSNVALNVGTNNTALGSFSGNLITSGSNNTLVGYLAGGNLTTGSSNIIIGYNISAASATGSNQLNIGNTIYGNTSTGSVGIGVASPTSKFHVRWADSSAGAQLYSDAAIFENSGNVFLQLMGGESSEKSINFGKPTNGADGAIKYNQSNVANGFGFWTNGNVLRMAITGDGNVGIGTATTNERLYVKKADIATNALLTRFQADTQQLFFVPIVGAAGYNPIPQAGDFGMFFNTDGFVIAPQNSTANHGGLRMHLNGAITLNMGTTPTYRLQLPNIASNLNGRGQANSWATYSSIRWKQDIVEVDRALEKISQLRGVYYYPKDGYGTGRQLGFIAEELGLIIPEVVDWDEDGVYASGVFYDRLTALNLQGLKELNAKVNVLESNVLGFSTTSLQSTSSKVINGGGWYRVAMTNTPLSLGKIRVTNSSFGSSQNLYLLIDNSNVNVNSNFTSGDFNFTKTRLNTVSGVTYLELYIQNTNNNSVQVSIDSDDKNWILTGVALSNSSGNIKEYALNGVLFGITDTFAVSKDSTKVSGTLLTTGSISNIGDSNNRWNDIYAKGSIRIGSGNKEGAIRYNVQKQRLELSNDGINWIEVGDLNSTMVISPEYAGAILYADGTDNYGKMTSDAEDSTGVFRNYYEWVSDREILQDYDILVRFNLPSDFVGWKSDAISLDLMTENSGSVENNKVDLYLMGKNGIDTEVKDGISKLPGSWERITLKSENISSCKKAGDTCTVRISMHSKDSYFVRVGDITLNYNRGL